MEILIAVGFVFLAAFFAGSETAFISVNRVNLHAKLETKDRRYRVLAWLMSRPEDMIGGFLVGTNIGIVAATLVFSGYMFRVSNQSPLTPLYVTLIMTPIILLFSDVFPKIIFRKFSDGIMKSLAYFYAFLFILMFPVQFIFVRTIRLILSIFGLGKKKKGIVSRDEFKLLLDITTEKGSIKEREKDFIKSIMNLKNIKAREIMVPLIQMICVEEQDTISRAATFMLSSRHGRLPVYRSRVDYIIGYIENKDIISAKKTDIVKDYIREALFMPESIDIDKLLVEFQASPAQMLFTVDEYGGISGVITAQDVVTEIVGEFIGRGEVAIKKKGKGYIVDGLLDIDELEDELSMYIEKFSFETVAGFLMYHLGRIPKRGDTFDFKKFTFEVASTNGFRIEKVKIYPKRKLKAK